MGQKVNPHGLRVGIIKDWDSRWFADKKNFGDSLVEDYNLRVFLKKKLFLAGVAKIEIEKFANKIRISIHAGKPGIVIGKGGSEIEKLKKELEKMTGKTIILNVIEVKVPDMSAQLVAENIASQLERRISFRMVEKTKIYSKHYGDCGNRLPIRMAFRHISFYRIRCCICSVFHGRLPSKHSEKSVVSESLRRRNMEKSL